VPQAEAKEAAPGVRTQRAQGLRREGQADERQASEEGRPEGRLLAEEGALGMHLRAPAATGGRLLRFSLAALGASVLLLAGASPAFAGAWWRLSSRSAPTLLQPGQKATIVISATNLGDAGVNATSVPVTIKDALPPGLEATEIRGEPAFHKEVSYLMTCELSALSCTSGPQPLPAFERLEVIITVNVKPQASTGEENSVSVHGGEQEGEPGVEVPVAVLSRPLTVGEGPTPFGVEAGGYALMPEEEGGAPDTQAGSHPFQLTTTLDLDQTLESSPKTGPTASAPALPKDLQFDLPPGLIGDPQAVARCPTVDFLAISEADTNACEPQSAIGVAVVTLDEPAHYGDITRAVPLWNLEPARGEPARFGFELVKVPVVLDTAVRSDGDYGVSVSVAEAPQSVQLLSSEVTIWGVPGEAAHDSSRGWACLLGGVYVNNEVPCEPTGQSSTSAFLTLPTSCAGQTETTVEGESWPVKSLGSEPGEIFSLAGSSTEDQLRGSEGCGALPFGPSIHLESPEHAASSPTGLRVDVHLPQQSTLQAGALGEADLKDTSVTLPEGVELSPSAANGLAACSEAEVGYEGQPGSDPFAPGAPAPLRFSREPAHCPEASKVASVRVHTPLLEHELRGAAYLAEQYANPFGSLLALYVVAEDPYSGVRVKLAGEVKLNETTGQITSTFTNAPQVPFEDFEVEFFSGPRASVSTPALCGPHLSTASFAPWSEPEGASVDSETPNPSDEFDITSGPGGGPCSDPQPFAPSFNAGAESLKAAGFSGFSLQITRPDEDQALTSVSVTLPPGAAALLSAVEPCPEPQASLGQCGPQSEIGEASAVSGLGPDPYTVTGGRVYITGPYDGAPFGLSIVTPAVAGPFNLGDVVVRSTINVNPETAAVTISSALPTIIKGVGMASSGIPLQLKEVHVTVDRPNFEFNPTNCTPMAITGTLTGAQGGSEAVSSRFQVQGCEKLHFAPKLTASTQGHASKADGASLLVKVTSQGLGVANIAKVDLQLPKALPSRLSTIQKACVASVFEANPASCDEGSVIGYAVIHTPVFRNPLTGPAYLVSHGNAAFPDVEFVLQGEGVEIILDGETDIKGGITYSKFESAPDAPFTTFETVLPSGPHSALAASVPEKDKFSLCGQTLQMPTTITAQNGVVIKQSTNIALSGCAKALSRSQLLAKALKACKKDKKKAKRLACEKLAKKRYAAKPASHKKTKTAKHGKGA
jgi:hypothetical protein